MCAASVVSTVEATGRRKRKEPPASDFVRANVGFW
jgi:hypothetical protein